MGQKRRRIALSCVDCRRRKVKCDRTYPQCIRCQKGGYGDKCVYVRHTGDQPNDNFPTPEEEGDRHSQCSESWVEEAAQYQTTAQQSETRAHQHLVTTDAAAALQGNPIPEHTHEPTSNQEQKINQLQGRLMQLEAMVYAAGGKLVSPGMLLGLPNPVGPGTNREPSCYSNKHTLADHEKVVLRGKSFKTQYAGPSNSISILLQFEDLSKFVREILLTIPSLSNHKLAMSKIREKEKIAAKAQYDISIESLVAMVPDRSFADRLLHQYLDTVETSYRIVHVPTFLKDYEAFWASPRGARPDFVIQLLVAMAMMYCMIPGGEEGFVGRSSARRETASHWINVCNYWFESQSKKHVAVVNYQLQIQIWLAKCINCIKVKRIWTDSGGLVRRFMAAGLHREPSLLCSKINAFDCEMRRRLWYTVLELDLQATIDRGITPTIGPMDWDTNPPRNIDDESFNIDTATLPEAKPRDEFTRTSFLAWATESLPMRIELLYKINSIRNTLDHDIINAYDDKIRAWIDEIPLDSWKDAVSMLPGSSSISPSIHHLPTPSSLSPFTSPTPSPLIALTLSQALTREYLTILHQPFATDMAFKSRHFHSRVARRYACLYTILLYNPQLSRSDATTSATGPSALDPRFHLSDSQRRYFAYLREDYVRAALSLAHDFAVSSEIKSNPFRIPVQDDNRVIPIIEAALNMLGDRVLNLGQGFHSYWITSSALSFVHSKQSPDVPRKAFTHAAADRVVGIHSVVIDGQVARARRMMVPTPGVERMPSRSMSPANAALPEQNISRRTEEITAVDGTHGLRRRASARQLKSTTCPGTEPSTGANSSTDPAASGSGSVPGNSLLMPGNTSYTVAGLGDMSGDILGFDQELEGTGPGTAIGTGDPLQDMMFGLENMDWNMLMNTDPTDFMGGGFYYPS